MDRHKERVEELYCHWVKSSRIRSDSSPHFPAFGLNTERYFVTLHIESECEKIRTRITQNTEFFRVVSESKDELILRKFLHENPEPTSSTSTPLSKIKTKQKKKKKKKRKSAGRICETVRIEI